MAMYKVPQDVEAEDKLLGPFSFRQFIYLIVAALGIFLGYGLSRIFVGLIIIPAPIVIFFLVLALPLKKDQPMETYLTAIVRFLLKPRLRMWDPEGELNLVEITAAKTDDGPALKNFSGQEASQRLQYLSQIVDTGGWASRGISSPLENLNLQDTYAAEAQSAEDMFDTAGSVSQNLGSMIAESNEARKQEVLQSMQASALAPTQQFSAPTSQPTTRPGVVTAPTTQAQVTPVDDEPFDMFAPQASVISGDPAAHVTFNPYPSAMHQKVVNPGGPMPKNPQHTAAPADPKPKPAAQKQAQAPSEETISPDIMRLAANKDLSISTIAREAERINKKHLEDEEVVVSLR